MWSSRSRPAAPTAMTFAVMVCTAMRSNTRVPEPSSLHYTLCRHKLANPRKYFDGFSADKFQLSLTFRSQPFSKNQDAGGHPNKLTPKPTKYWQIITSNTFFIIGRFANDAKLLPNDVNKQNYNNNGHNDEPVRSRLLHSHIWCERGALATTLPATKKDF